MLNRDRREQYCDVRLWVIEAIADEERKPSESLWKNAPSGDDVLHERLRRIRFLRKYGLSKPGAISVADRLQTCEPMRRCLSGACPECGRLLQRWFVRQSKQFIARHLNKPSDELIAISIVPSAPLFSPGQLGELSITNLQRRLKWAFDRVNLKIAIGGIDFSFNEDQNGRYQPFWSAHHYLITSTTDTVQLGLNLRGIFRRSNEVPRPVKLTPFSNKPRRRSYALKMSFYRRIGHDDIKLKNGKTRKCRNTNRDRLRAKERLELFIYLNQIGLASRVVFRGAKPIINSLGVSISPIG